MFYVTAQTMIDRHRVLNLFENIHEKYSLKECEYKEFLEALMDKKFVELDVTDWKYVKVTYDLVEADVDFCDDEWYPSLSTRSSCTRLWSVVDDTSTYHGVGCVSYSYMNSHNIHRAVVKRMYEDMQLEKFTTMTLDSTTNRKICLRVKSIEKVG